MTESINALRGEIKFKIGEVTYKGRLSIDGIVKLEDQLGGSIIDIGGRISLNQGTAVEVIAILQAVIDGHKDNDGKGIDAKAIIESVSYLVGYKVAAKVINDAIAPQDKPTGKRRATGG